MEVSIPPPTLTSFISVPNSDFHTSRASSINDELRSAVHAEYEEYQLSTKLYVNTDPASTRTRAIENNTPEYAARYIDEKNVIHPMAITFKRAEGDQSALTRSATAEQGIYGTYLPEQMLGIQDDGGTRGWGSFWKGVKKVFGSVTDAFEDLAAGTVEWNVDLDFGLNWNIFKYPSDNASDEVKKNIEEINKQGLKLIEFNERQLLGKKLDNDSEVMEYTKQYLHLTAFKFIPFTVKAQKKAIISSQLDEFAEKYGRAPINNDADFQTLKSMTLEKIKTIDKQELYKLCKKAM